VRSELQVVPAAPFLPGALGPLAAHADAEGIRIVSTVRARWEDGSERFLGPGEAILAAVAGDEVIGIGALSQCPDVLGALRMRRFYVAPSWRRHGVGRALASQLIEAGHAHTGILTCNAQASAAAAPFWESLGFVRSELERITHVHRR